MPSDVSTRGETAASWHPIYDGVLDAIARHRLGPGAKIVEEDIADIYGVSRTVVRSALQALARDGVVILQHNRGARIAYPTPDEAREIFEARAVVEPPLAALAAARMRPADVALLKASIEAEHMASNAENSRAVVFHSIDFHRRIARLSGQGVLAGIVDGLLLRSSLVIALYWRQPATPCKYAAHLSLLNAFAGGKGSKASRLMQRHVETLLAELDLTSTPLPSSHLSNVLKAGGR